MRFSKVFTVVGAVQLIAGLLFLLFFYQRNLDKVEDEEFKSKWGGLYEDFDLKKPDQKTARRSVLLYPMVIILKRIGLLLIAFLFTDLVTQVVMFSFVTIGVIIFIVLVKPYQERYNYWLDLMNEFIDLMVLAFIIGFKFASRDNQ